MRRKARFFTRAAGVATAALAVVVLGATGCKPPQPIELTVADQSMRGPHVPTYTVRCGPKTAEVTPAIRGIDAATACRVITAERSLLVDGPPPQGACAQVIVGWERFKVTGHVDKATVDRIFSRSNSCSNATYLSLVGLFPAPAAQLGR